MPSKKSTALSSLFFYLRLASAATGQGSVSLWSNNDCGRGDTMAFSEPVFIAKVTPNADECADLSRAATASASITAQPATTGFGPALNSFDRSDEYDGECLALVEFRSLAFICDGVGQISDKPTHTASSSETAPSAFIGGPSLTTTLIALSAYTLLPNITASGHSGPIETASVLPSQTGGLSPSPSPFTGGAPMIQLSTLGTILLAFGVIVFI